MVCITGQVPFAAIGTDAFQECDTVGITRSVTKHNELITDAQDIPLMVREAFHLATTGRPGAGARRRPQGHRRPQNPRRRWSGTGRATTRSTCLPATSRPPRATPSMIREAAEPDPPGPTAGDLRRRRHPQGPGRRGAPRAGRAVRHPRGHHAHGPGRLPRRPPAVPGHAGHARQLHGGHLDAAEPTCSSPWAAASTTASPARSTAFAPDAKIIHVDIDPAELGKVRRPDVPIVGDCRLVIEELVTRPCASLSGAEGQSPTARPGSRPARGWQENYPLTYQQSDAGRGAQAPVRARAAARQHARRHDRRRRRGPAPDVDQPVLALQPPLHLGQLRRARHHGLRRARRPSAPRWAGPTAWCGRSTATAASR